MTLPPKQPAALPATSRLGQNDPPLPPWLPAFILAAALIARLYEAWAYFLNPDEALHNLLASQDSLRMAYRAALTQAHPPLLILVLYYWRSLGHSELMLRLPSVLAGTAACWFAYQWLKLVTDRSAAFLGLLLFAFAPSLVGLSAEVRQYALLLFFTSACLYLSERALQHNSALCMILFSLSLYGALLSHYSSLIFAFTLGIYLLVRLYPYSRRHLGHRTNRSASSSHLFSLDSRRSPAPSRHGAGHLRDLAAEIFFSPRRKSCRTLHRAPDFARLHIPSEPRRRWHPSTHRICDWYGFTAQAEKGVP